LPGAVNLPRPFAEDDVAALGDAMLVVYCWGPGCNGATKAARELAALGRPVKEMPGGFMKALLPLPSRPGPLHLVLR